MNMQRVIAMEEIVKLLNEEEVEETVLVKRKNKSDVVIMNLNEYRKIFEEKNLIEKLKKAEEQIKNGEVTDADIVFKEMREKYGY